MSNYNPVLDLIKLSLDYQFLKLKYFCEVKDGTHDTPAYVDATENTYPLVTSKDIDNGVVSLENAKHISEEDYLAINRRSNVEKYDVIMPMIGTIGNPAIIDIDEKFSIKNVALFKTNGDLIKAKYLKYLLSSEIVQKQINLLNRGGVQSFVSLGVLENISITMSDDINKIVSYLDLKTSAIDELISSKERLIQLLEEKHQSMITEAVTKGLDPNVKMKDSGVEWIGEIPEHWDLKKIGYLGRLQNGISKSSDAFGSGYPFVSYGDVYRNGVLPNSVDGLVNSSEEERQLYSVEKGDVFFTRTSETIDEIGFASTCLKTLANATFAGFLIRFRPTSDKIIPSYSKYYFRSSLGRRYFVKEMNIVTRASLGQGLLRNFIVILPPTEEQEEIAKYLDFKTDAIDKSIYLIKSQIQKLKEYRQSLIYEVVTGKIDVRDFEVEE
ncbi:restriction endonuclease subunit S [Bacillus sp. S13(2024)]|uniref:restriction endonuclease subunit S n=1 Tax=unclassified Bacillus (in: firmicutes) TaxID=185979 RepID=UPI003D1E3F20